MATFTQRVQGAIYGGAIGDAMGAPVEGWTPEKICQTFRPEDLTKFLPPTHGGDASKGKGHGRITDDTLMIEVLIGAYLEHGDHMDAYGYEKYMVPRIGSRPMWVPEYQQEMRLFNRLSGAEQLPFLRIIMSHPDPRSAGAGNNVNCGVAMWTMPVGAVNAGDPQGAYYEAAAIGLAHNESFAVEAGAVMAACAAAALAPKATLDSIAQAALATARDGTKFAIAACLAATNPADDLDDWIRKTRAAMTPYDQVVDHVADDQPMREEGISNKGHPSRLHAIEELPVALAAVKYGQGDFLRTIQAAVFYGRDCDSIASMAGALLGAIRGVEGIPADLRQASNQANRRDFSALGDQLATLAGAIADKDAARMNARRATLTQ
jgi:ADP-ribosylglycohydrolase